MQECLEEKEKQIESFQQDSQCPNLTFIAYNEAVTAQFKGITDKNNELKKQIEFISRNKQYIEEPDANKSIKL